MRISLHGGWALCLLVLLAAGALAQGAGGAQPYVPGEVLVWARAGAATQNDVQALAAAAKADLKRPLLMEDTYLLTVRAAKNGAATDTEVQTAMAALKATGVFRWVGTNRLYQLHAVPNDPRYKEQWHLPLINMPQAWDITKGSDSVVICILDNGGDVTHPDLASRIVGFQNFYDPTKNDAAGMLDANPFHGTHVAGLAAAVTDNAVGVAGVNWQGSKLFIGKCGDGMAVSVAAAIDAIAYIRKNINKSGTSVVVNMSFGGADVSDEPDVTSPFAVAILGGASDGIIFCISAGNAFEGGNPPINPANLASKSPNIICVAACGPRMEHAAYSSARPYTTITAPGGNDPSGTDTASEMLSTAPVADGSYGFEQGTSMASPVCTGVVSLLLGAGVQPLLIKDILTSSANSAGQAVPNDQYGYGVVDAYAALQNIMSVTVVAPSGTGGKAGGQTTVPQPVETLRPSFDIAVRQVTPDQVTITIDGNPVTVTTDMITNVKTTTKDANGNVVPTSYDLVFTKDLAPGKHTVVVTGTGGTPPKTVSDTRVVTITPHLVPAGRAMVAIPYVQATDQQGNPLDPVGLLQYYFGTGFRLARWVPDQSRYAFMSSFGIVDPNFIPAPGLMPKIDGTTPAFPLGVGLWSDVESAKPILTYGTPAPAGSSVYIPLVGTAGTKAISWNMVGDPFPFDVPFNSTLVQTPEGILPIQVAADKGYVLPNLYTYDPTVGYTYETLPNGTITAWTGYWVGVTSSSNVTLIVPPAKVTRAATVAARPTALGSGWIVQLGATAGAARDTFNFIGESSAATDGYDRNDVAKPPATSQYVALSIAHDDWKGRASDYAQDIRALGGTKTWSVVVSTDLASKPVTVSWNAGSTLPRSQRLTMKDEATGQVIDMRTRSAYTFTSGDTGAARRLTVTAAPASGSIVRIGNLMVRPAAGRASGVSSIDFTLSSDASYEVKVLSSTGATVNTVATRAASAGDVHLVWTGKDGAGRSVAAGMYIVHIRAVGSDGSAVNAVQPFTVVR